MYAVYPPSLFCLQHADSEVVHMLQDYVCENVTNVNFARIQQITQTTQQMELKHLLITLLAQVMNAFLMSIPVC